MKNLIKKVSSVIVIALFIMGCSKDDEVDAVVVTPPTNAELIIGTWKWTGSLDNGEKEGTLSECEVKTSFVFDGMQYIWNLYEGEVAPCSKEPNLTAKYSIKGNIISFDGKTAILDAFVAEIKVLNATKLELLFRDEDDTTINTYIRLK